MLNPSPRPMGEVSILKAKKKHQTGSKSSVPTPKDGLSAEHGAGEHAILVLSVRAVDRRLSWSLVFKVRVMACLLS